MATYGNTGGARGPAQKAAAQRVWNQASKKMETRQAMHNYKRPAPQAPASQHTSSTSHTTTTVSHPAPTLLQMTPAQILDRAKRIVNSEVAAERLPFQQRQTALTGEQAGVQAAHTANYQQLDTGTAALQAKQSASAKTYQNEAADRLKQAESITTGEPGEAESTKRQREASRTLLTSIAAGSQAGTTARQQAEENFLTNVRATGQQQGAAGTTQIGSEYGKQKQSTADQEAQLLAGKSGRVGKYAQSLEGESEKLKLAAAALGNQQAKTINTERGTAATIRNQQATQGLGRAKLNQSASEGAANREQRENASKRTAATAAAGRTAKLNAQHEKKTGQKPTKEQGAITKEIANTFTAFETIVRNRTLGKGGGKRSEQSAFIRKHLPAGKAGELSASNPWALRAGEELWFTHKVSKATRSALGRMGLNIGYDPEIFKAVSGK